MKATFLIRVALSLLAPVQLGCSGSDPDEKKNESDDSEYTGTYEGMIAQCLRACERYNGDCSGDLDCPSYCDAWLSGDPRECDAVKETYLGCIAEQPSSCVPSDLGNGLEDVCDPIPESTCRLAGGRDCGRNDTFQTFCPDSYAYYCQKGKAPSICEEEDPYAYPGLYCCTSPDL